MKTAMLALVACAALAGCATKQFAQVGDVTDYEKTAMTCHDIDIEMAKTRGVQQANTENDKFDGRSVLAFLGDFGIGNSMAKSSADESTTRRMTELDALRAQKNCGLSTAAAQQTN
jgi:hypothetical protein